MINMRIKNIKFAFVNSSHLQSDVIDHLQGYEAFEDLTYGDQETPKWNIYSIDTLRRQVEEQSDINETTLNRLRELYLICKNTSFLVIED